MTGLSLTGAEQSKRQRNSSQPQRLASNRVLAKIKVREPACKPGSVQPAKAGLGSHSSGMPVTRHLKQPTRIQCGSHLQDSYLVLLQAGFTVPWTVTSHAVRSYRTLSPLPVSVVQHRLRRSTLCCTFRRLSPPRRYLAPYPLEPGLSSIYPDIDKYQAQVNSDCPASSRRTLYLLWRR